MREELLVVLRVARTCRQFELVGKRRGSIAHLAEAGGRFRLAADREQRRQVECRLPARQHEGEPLLVVLIGLFREIVQAGHVAPLACAAEQLQLLRDLMLPLRMVVAGVGAVEILDSGELEGHRIEHRSAQLTVARQIAIGMLLEGAVRGNRLEGDRIGQSCLEREGVPDRLGFAGQAIAERLTGRFRDARAHDERRSRISATVRSRPPRPAGHGELEERQGTIALVQSASSRR